MIQHAPSTTCGHLHEIIDNWDYQGRIVHKGHGDKDPGELTVHLLKGFEDPHNPWISFADRQHMFEEEHLEVLTSMSVGERVAVHTMTPDKLVQHKPAASLAAVKKPSPKRQRRASKPPAPPLSPKTPDAAQDSESKAATVVDANVAGLDADGGNLSPVDSEPDEAKDDDKED